LTAPPEMRKYQDRFIWTTLAACVASGLYALYYLAGYQNAVVHPHFFIDNMRALTDEHLEIRWREVLNVFYAFGGPLEYRPRFLMYLILFFDYHLRFFLYDYVLVPPTFSVAWVPQLIVGPYYFYRLMRNLTRDKQAAWLTLAVYLSSVGFLSGISIAFAPGKALSHVIYILALFLASALDRRAAPRRPLLTIPGPEKYLLLALLFFGTFLDEMPFFAFALVPLMFPARFLPFSWKPGELSRSALNAALWVLPFACFLFFTLVVTPIITEHIFHYRFDYIDTLLNRNLTVEGTLPAEGALGDFSVRTVVVNFLALFGSTIVPLETKRVLYFLSGVDPFAPPPQLISYV